MGPTPAWMGSPKITPGMEDEWAEMLASLVYYAKVTRGLQFNLLGPANEVDWDGIEGPQVTADQYVLLLHKLAVKLDALGLTDIRLVGPDTAQAGVGVNDYFPALMSDPVIMAKMAHLSFHNYGDQSANADAVIKASAYPTKDFWVTEAGMGIDYYGPERLMMQIKNGATSAGVWDARAVQPYQPRRADDRSRRRRGSHGRCPTRSSSSSSSRRRAQRIGTSPQSVVAIAFYNPSSGQITIVGHNQTGSRNMRISLANLPAVGAMQLP